MRHQNTDFGTFSRRASGFGRDRTDWGYEIRRCWAVSASWTGDRRIDHVRDGGSHCSWARYAALLARLGLWRTAIPHPRGTREALVTLLVKPSSPRCGPLRGMRHTHARRFPNPRRRATPATFVAGCGLCPARIGAGTALFVPSGGAGHQGPDAAGLDAVIRGMPQRFPASHQMENGS